MPWYDDILARLRGVRPVMGRGNEFMCVCPLHKGGQERTASLSVKVDGDEVLLFCHACGAGATPEIVRLLGLRMADLFHREGDRPRKNRMALKVTAEFVYEDEGGRPLYKAVRYELPGGGKTFAQFRHHQGQWLPGLGPAPGVPGADAATRRVLYRLPGLLKDPGQPVLVVEGEAKADLLTSWGLVATCGVGGAGMGWQDAYSDALAGRRVAVLPDHDAPGYRHADAVLGGLVRRGAASARVVLLPGLPAGGDVIDFARAGGSRARLLELVRATPEWKPCQ